MALANPFGIVLQNLWQTWVFSAAFVAMTLVTGAIVPVLLAFFLASLGSFLYLSLINRTLPTPPNTAVLITGCSSGIGADAALRLSRAGFLVFATVRKEEDGQRLRQRAHSPALLVPVLLDVTNAEQLTAAVATVRQRLEQEGRRLLGVINNAGYCEYLPMELCTPELLRDQFETNVVGSVAVTQAFLPLLRDFALSSPSHQARLVLVSSVVGRFTSPGVGAYCASKHSIEAIGDSLRMELRKWRIHVSVLEPGAIGSEFLDTSSSGYKRRIAESKAALEKGTLAAGGAVLEHYLASVEKSKRGMSAVPMESVEWTSDAMERAMLDSRPLSRYTAGWTSLSIQVFTKMPTELYDRLMGRDYA